MKNFWIIAVLGVVLAGTLTGCNTTEGVGEDVEQLGQEIKNV